jgi:hypothetical protein
MLPAGNATASIAPIEISDRTDEISRRDGARSFDEDVGRRLRTMATTKIATAMAVAAAANRRI